MRPKKAAELTSMLDYIEHNNDVMFRDLRVAFPEIDKSIIGSNLATLYEYGCIEKEKVNGEGNLCKYNYIKPLVERGEISKDWSLLVDTFNNLVRMRWIS